MQFLVQDWAHAELGLSHFTAEVHCWLGHHPPTTLWSHVQFFLKCNKCVNNKYSVSHKMYKWGLFSCGFGTHGFYSARVPGLRWRVLPDLLDTIRCAFQFCLRLPEAWGGHAWASEHCQAWLEVASCRVQRSSDGHTHRFHYSRVLVSAGCPGMDPQQWTRAKLYTHFNELSFIHTPL